jgi:inorganic pyrophosphatase
VGSGIAMVNLLKIPTWTAERCVHVVVETPRGARAKLTFEPGLEAFVLSKSLMLGLSYPYDWGFVPSTLADDGDPLDAMVLHDVATSPGLVLRCKAIGVLQVAQTIGDRRERNDRIIAVPKESHREAEMDDVKALPAEVKDELERFFAATTELEAKAVKFIGWRGPKAAEKLIRTCQRAFKTKNAA